MLKKLDDLSEFDWISASRWPLGSREDRGDGHTIRHLLPDSFESYYKILHPMYRDTSVADESRKWRREDKFRDRDLVRITWKELAKKFGVPYHRQINPHAFGRTLEGGWPRYIVSASEGELDAPYLARLGQVLSRHTSSTCWYFEYFQVATEFILTDELYVGELSDLASANEHAHCRSGPTYWWPEDRAWCVCTDYDLSFTVVGSTAVAQKDLEDMEDIEGFAMRVSDRIDYRSHLEHDSSTPYSG